MNYEKATIPECLRTLVERGIMAKEESDRIISELTKSEDERIRKELIDHCIQGSKQRTIVSHKEDYKRWLAWLEKQKENTYGELMAYGEREHQRGFDEGVASVKPAGWSEDDDNMLQAIIKRYGFAVESDCAVFIKKERLTQMEKELAWLKSLRPQQKQEVVDRNVFYRIADILRWCDLPIGCPVENFKQSESEREHLLEIVQCVAHRYANSCTYCKEYSRGYQDGLANHRWKPSDDQMEVLSRFNDPVLKSLYSDLQKLL